MEKMTLLLENYGLLLLFANVFLTQIGVPIPALPALVIAGALSMNGQLVGAECLLAGLAACMLSDLIWFAAGRRYGKKILNLLCRISISPVYCVSRTEDTFSRWGVGSLVFSRFIPGFSVVGPPLAGALGIPRPQFMLFSSSGALLWVATGLGLGALFHSRIDQLLALLATVGETVLILLALLIAVVIAIKFVERRRFNQSLRMARITVGELRLLMTAMPAPVIVDVRSRVAQKLDAPIPGALMYDKAQPQALFISLPKETPVVVYCSCPNEASAVLVARQLIDDGFFEVRPLTGGLDAWNAQVVLASIIAPLNSEVASLQATK